jgi:hypothetical protein
MSGSARPCRDPFCDAAIRHIDHITRDADGRLTPFTNGRGVCARGNLIEKCRLANKPTAVTRAAAQDHHHDTTQRHHYLSRAPDPPLALRRAESDR